MRLSNTQAQSVIEYIVVFVLVGMGIAIMGPYAIRSINGHLKAWEDAVDDSIKDPLPDFDPTNLPIPKCACSPVLPHGCGLGGCPATTMLYQRDCNPLGCQDARIPCAEDSACCASSAPVRECGGCESNRSCCTPWVPAGTGSCRGDEGCPVGLVWSKRQCGGGAGTQFSCQPSSTCAFRCQGNPPDDSTPCPGTTVGLRRDEVWVPVVFGGCVPSMKCQSECVKCFIANGVTGACDCAGCVVCSPGTCYQGSCGPGFCEKL